MAQEAAQRGERQMAHGLCVHLTSLDPRNVAAWLLRAETCDAPEEKVAALSRVLAINPSDPAARRGLYEALQGLLRKDAFLSYVSETTELYDVRTPADLEIIQPKGRAAVEPFPPPAPLAAQAVHRWMGWSLIGLIPAGVGTLFCAPAAMIAAVRLLRGHPAQADRRRAWVTLGLAPVLWLVAVLFAVVLMLHIL